MLSIRKTRQALGLTLTAIAAKTGLLPQAISRAERDGIDPRASTVQAIARAMGVPVCELYDVKVKHERHERRRKRTAKR